MIAVAVTVVTVVYDLMVAVGAGVTIAIIQFVNAQIKSPVINWRTTAVQRPLLRRRTEEARDLLEAFGDRAILVSRRPCKKPVLLRFLPATESM